MAAGVTPFANPRNAAAGTIRQRVDKRWVELNDARESSGSRSAAKIERLEHEYERAVGRLAALGFTAHGIGAREGIDVTSQSETYALLANMGIPVSSRMAVHSDVSGVREYIDFYAEHRHDVEHEIDGVVIKVDDFSLQTQLGRPRVLLVGPLPLSIHPRWFAHACWISPSMSDAPVASLPLPSWNRYVLRDRRCRWRRCTTNTKCNAKVS